MEKWNKTILALENLQCPILSRIESLGEGELRNSLLQWMFFMYNPEWMNEREIKQEREIERLTRLAHGLGLCKESDIDVLKGSSGTVKDLDFIHTFVDLLLLKHQLKRPFAESNEVAKDVQLMNSIVMGNIFKNNNNNINNNNNQFLVSNLFHPGTSLSSAQSLSHVERQCQQLETAIAKLKQELATYKTEDVVASHDEVSQLLHNLKFLMADYTEDLGKLSCNLSKKRGREVKGGEEMSYAVQPMLQNYEPLAKMMHSYKTIHEQRANLPTFDHFQVPSWLKS